MGTLQGLICFNGGSSVTYTVDDRLPNHICYFLLEDDAGNIWIGTGYLLHLPSRQTWNMIDEILDTSEGHDFSLFEFFVTRDKEER